MKYQTAIILALLAAACGQDYTHGPPTGSIDLSASTTESESGGETTELSSGSTTDDDSVMTSTDDASTTGTEDSSSTTEHETDTEAVLASICGDGIWADDELCDDGNQNDRDWCSNDCWSRKVVFLTPKIAGWAINNQAWADDWCSSLAHAQGYSMYRRWQAWLGTDEPGILLYPGRFQPLLEDVGWYVLPGPTWDVGGQPVARGWPALAYGPKHELPIDRDIMGATVLDFITEVWTNVGSNGLLKGATTDCGGWSDAGADGRVGNFKAQNLSWTDDHVRACDQSARLYCMEQRLWYSRSELPQEVLGQLNKYGIWKGVVQ